MAKPKRFALTRPFNLYPDGDETTEVVGIELVSYAEGGALAACLVFANGGAQPISVNLTPEEMRRLDVDELFFKNWSEMEPVAEILIQQGIVAMVPDKEPAKSGDVEIPVARLVRSALRDAAAAETKESV